MGAEVRADRGAEVVVMVSADWSEATVMATTEAEVEVEVGTEVVAMAFADDV